MGLALKQSTASQEIPLGYFLDSTDGDSEETALTINNTDIKIWKNGATTLANKNSGGATHISNGVYYATLDATDTDTVGPMVIFVHVSGALTVRLECHVYEEAIYDALYGASAAAFDSNQRVDVGSWLGTAVTTSSTTSKPEVDVNSVSDDATAANNLELDYDGTGYAKANSTIGTTTTNTDMRGTDNAALASVVGALTDAAAAGDPTTADTIMQYIKQLINVLVGTTGVTTYPASAAPANNVSLAEIIRAIYDDTNSLDGTKIPDTVSLANINAEVDTALGTTTYAELSGVPAATSTLADKINWLFILARNKITQTATTSTLRNDADGANVSTSTISDDGTTATRGEWT